MQRVRGFRPPRAVNDTRQTSGDSIERPIYPIPLMAVAFSSCDAPGGIACVAAVAPRMAEPGRRVPVEGEDIVDIGFTTKLNFCV
jgi:hypothetical protein